MVYKPPTTGYQQYNDSTYYKVPNSLRFRSANSCYFLKTTFGASTNNKKRTVSVWVKVGGLGVERDIIGCDRVVVGNYNLLYFNTTDNLVLVINGTTIATTVASYRDTSAWYHIVLQYDSTASNANIYVNGKLAAFGSVTLNTASGFFDSVRAGNLGCFYNSSGPTFSYFYDGYMAEFHALDGIALGPENFGRFDSSGNWVPKKYVGSLASYGNNGFYLPFSNKTSVTTLGYDYKDPARGGTPNDWTPTNMASSLTAGASYDWMLDTPTNNFCTLNPLNLAGATIPYNGNLVQATSTLTGACNTGSVVTTGHWFWEVTVTAVTNNAIHVGVLQGNLAGTTTTYALNPGGVKYHVNGEKWIDGVNSLYGAAWAGLGPYTIGVELNLNNNTVRFHLDGAPQPSISLPANIHGWTAHSGFSSSSGSGIVYHNFGQAPLSSGATYYPSAGGWFKYAPPSGAKALCTGNL